MPNGKEIIVIREVTTNDRYVATVAPDVAPQLQDVVAMKGGREIARWQWFDDSKPLRNSRTVRVNSTFYPAQWA